MPPYCGGSTGSTARLNLGAVDRRRHGGRPGLGATDPGGANLAVRADAYLDCGGFPIVGHGEDQLLVDDLARRGHRVARTRNVRVRTSGRLAGRADRGLAAHLHRLHLAGQVLPYTGTV